MVPLSMSISEYDEQASLKYSKWFLRRIEVKHSSYRYVRTTSGKHEGRENNQEVIFGDAPIGVIRNKRRPDAIY